MSKRLVRKLDLELFISAIPPSPYPTPRFEQYTIPVKAAATMLYIAAYVRDHVLGKTVLDLGCGTGRLALAAALLGANKVVGVDLDKNSIKLACKHSQEMGFEEKTCWITADIDAIHGDFDTVLQNPPFGVQQPKADRKFLKKALETGTNIYSLHKSQYTTKDHVKKFKTAGLTPSTPSPFLKDFIEKHGGEITAVYTIVLTLPHTFRFHTKKNHDVLADLYVLKKKASLKYSFVNKMIKKKANATT